MKKLRWMILAFAATVAVGVTILQVQAPRAGVRPVVWGRESCRECHMSIDDPSFAAQLQMQDGRVFDFDDPGCLFRYLARAHSSVHAVYFHSVKDDRWLRSDETAFVATRHSPMGYDLGAVARQTAPKARSFEQALEQWRRGDIPGARPKERGLR